VLGGVRVGDEEGQEEGGGRWEEGGGRWEVGGGRWEVGGGRREAGGGRWEAGGQGGKGEVRKTKMYVRLVVELRK
jgi:hypothetical protein